MKNFFTLLFVFFIGSAQAANYYFSSVAGDDTRTSTQAKSASTPWKSISKLNTIFSSLRPGDSVLFKRGETFSGSIKITRSGIKGAPIVLGAYGTGNKPVITALTTLTNWVAVGNGIYESYNPSLGTTLNIMLLNDAQQPMGRYPNKGYLTLESHVGSTSITDNELSSTPNWKGAELVIRPSHWVMNRYLITSHSGNTLYFSGASASKDKYGYFIQNSIKALDRLGEWCYNATTKKVSMYFGGASPASFAVRASTGKNLVHSGDKSYIVFDNLTIKGANENGFGIHSGSNFIVKNCDVLFSGINGVHVSGHTGFKLENSTVLNSNNDGVNAGSTSTIRNNYIKNSYSIAGMGQNGDGMGAGIRVTSKGLVEYNKIINAGFIGIQFTGDSSVIKNNYIDTFCFVKDDGGAIYAPNSLNLPRSGRKVIGNIILNGIGAAEGTDITVSNAEGIYMDDDCNGVEITGNTVANCHRGLYLHNSRNIVIKNNTCFNNTDGQLNLKYDGLGGLLRNHTVTNNIFFSKHATEIVSAVLTKKDNSDIAAIGRLDSNHYARPIANTDLIFTTTYLYSSSQKRIYNDLAEWKTMYNKDAASKLSVKKIASYTVNSLTSANKCTFGSLGVSADIKNVKTSSCTVLWQNAGVLDGGYLKITPSAITSFISMNVGAISSSKKYILRYSLKGAGTMNIKAYLRNSSYNSITLTEGRPVSTTRSGNEIMFTPSSGDANASLVFKVDAQVNYYLDNIQLYEANATETNPDDSIRFVYNASQVSKTIILNGNYVDVKNNKFSNSIVLKPYSSAVLISNGGIQNAAPTVSIASPVANATFAAPASVTISAVAADADGRVSKVGFYNGSTLLGTDTASPYTFTWNNVAAGNYTITAKATDNGSLVTTSAAIAISVYASNVAPSVSITSPVASGTFVAPASVTISAVAADADGKVNKVEFYNGTTLLGIDTSSPYTFTWSNVAAGNYTITAKATDNGSLATTSAVVTISVYAANVPPSVSITSPVANTTFAAPASVIINAVAADADGSISKVDFYNGDTLLQTVTESPYTFTWNNVTPGNYTITAKATDNGSLITTSAAVAIAVAHTTNDTNNIAPSVRIRKVVTSTPVGSLASVTISADATDADGTISKVDFYNGDTLLETVTASPYTIVWNNVAGGSYTITTRATDNKGAETASSKVTISVVPVSVSERPSNNKPSNVVAPAPLDLKVFPNPASNTVFVSGTGLAQNTNFIISVISMNGTVVKTIRANTSDKAVEVNISTLSAGVYTIKAIAGSVMISKQFVKL